MVMFDSLNRKMLEPYGCDWIPTPNFKRLADRAVTFDCNYVGSMPCMPARRELHTGRLNFQHRSWGPLEPFDDSMPEILKNNGIYTHLTTDHQHYWEDGGATYHHRYSSFDLNRGQEGDPWKTNQELLDAAAKRQLVGPVNYFDKANRQSIIGSYRLKLLIHTNHFSLRRSIRSSLRTSIKDKWETGLLTIS